MALIKKSAVKETTTEAAKPNPSFEEVNDNDDVGGDAAAASAETATASASASATVDNHDRIAEAATAHAAKKESTAVAPRASNTAVAVPQRSIVSPFETMKSAFHVDYDTLLQVQGNQGQFMTKADKKSLGDTITMELMSFQDNYVISPGEEGPEAAKLVKYSDDGVTTKDGLDCKEYLKELIEAGYEKSKLSQRSVLVGVLLSSLKQKELEGTLFQIDMPPTSKKAFDRYQIQSAYDTSKGKYTVEAAKIIQMSCRVDSKSMNGQTKDWTVVDFSRGTAPAAA